MFGRVRSRVGLATTQRAAALSRPEHASPHGVAGGMRPTRVRPHRPFHSSPLLGIAPVPPSPAAATPALSDHLINQLADRPARPVSLAEMRRMGSRPELMLVAAQWLWSELPVRLAKRLRDLDDLPFGLSKSVEVQSLMSLYRTSLTDALAVKCPRDSLEELAFTDVVKTILTRHQHIVVDLASGINVGFLRTRNGSVQNVGGVPTGMGARPTHQHYVLQEFLDRFNSARIGLRMLMAQHVALHSSRPNMVGIIEIGCDPARIIAATILEAGGACRSAYGYPIVPRVEVTDVSAKSGGIRNFHYVSAHLRFMLFELLKNSMRATVEHARKKKALAAGVHTEDGAAPPVELTDADLPPIQVILVDGPQDIVIKISDRGGGIKRSELPLIFTYTYSASQRMTSMAQQAEQVKEAQHAHKQAVEEARRQAGDKFVEPAETAPAATSDWLTGANFQPVLNTQLHDFVESFGLPITRLYARYLGGDLQLYSLNGHGTDSYLYLSRTGEFHEVIED